MFSPEDLTLAGCEYMLQGICFTVAVKKPSFFTRLARSWGLKRRQSLQDFFNLFFIPPSLPAPQYLQLFSRSRLG